MRLFTSYLFTSYLYMITLEYGISDGQETDNSRWQLTELHSTLRQRQSHDDKKLLITHHFKMFTSTKEIT